MRARPFNHRTILLSSFRASMKRIRADLSETELRGLERRFSAHLTAKTGFATGRGGEGGVRYVEFLHWGAPGRRAEEGGEEVCTKKT